MRSLISRLYKAHLARKAYNRLWDEKLDLGYKC
jgi:hypothetical protein